MTIPAGVTLQPKLVSVDMSGANAVSGIEVPEAGYKLLVTSRSSGIEVAFDSQTATRYRVWEGMRLKPGRPFSKFYVFGQASHYAQFVVLPSPDAEFETEHRYELATGGLYMRYASAAGQFWRVHIQNVGADVPRQVRARINAIHFALLTPAVSVALHIGGAASAYAALGGFVRAGVWRVGSPERPTIQGEQLDAGALPGVVNPSWYVVLDSANGAPNATLDLTKLQVPGGDIHGLQLKGQTECRVHALAAGAFDIAMTVDLVSAPSAPGIAP